MQTIAVSILLVSLAMLALGIGLAFGRGPLERSCGAGSCASRCAECPGRKEPS